MQEQLLNVAAAIVAGIIVMVFHELPKTMTYFIITRQKNPVRETFKLYRYIDPIGLLFCVIVNCGFSKPYIYRMRDRKYAYIIGCIGYLSLLACFFMGIGVARYGIGDISNYADSMMNYMIHIFCAYVFQYIALLSAGMLLINLFPLTAFDMGMIIASASADKFISIMRNDYIIKLILLLSIFLGVIQSISFSLFQLFY